jgi:hypothetical protein
MVGQPLDDDFASKFKRSGSSGAINLENQSVLLCLSDFKPTDLKEFEGPAELRVSRQKHFAIISVVFETFSFDIIWSPQIAKLSGEEIYDPGEEYCHPVFNFILLDEGYVVRGIRVATIDWPVAQAIQRAQQDLMQQDVNEDRSMIALQVLFSKYPNGLPLEVFHEYCALGA